MGEIVKRLSAKHVTQNTTVFEQPRYCFEVDGLNITAASFVPCIRGHTMWFLLAQTSHDKGQWQTLGGKVEKHDMHWRHTAMREFCEETGYGTHTQHVMSALDNPGEEMLYVPYARHAYWVYDVAESERMRWTNVDTVRMSKEDRTKILSINWLSSEQVATLPVRRDVKDALLAVIHAK